MNHSGGETEDSGASLLELAANDDVEGFKRWIERDPSGVDAVGLWYGRQMGSKQMVLEDRTPLMVAATYGSIDVLELILSLSKADVNQISGHDKSTALHCAASGGSLKAIDVVKLLLSAGADPNLTDTNGYRPADIIAVPPKFPEMTLTLKELLTTSGPAGVSNLRVSTAKSDSNSPPLSPPQENRSLLSASDSNSPPKSTAELPPSSAPEKKEYPVDPSLPDINDGLYSTDDFRMYKFKVQHCYRSYSHDWTECPFLHPGENARRRDPSKYPYSCVPCPDFRKGACRRGDSCEYAHGVFECWLHPAQYRTKLCKDGMNCNRKVCFFAHRHEELRPIQHVFNGPASPQSVAPIFNGMDFAAAMSPLPNSPSSIPVMAPQLFSPPISPSANRLGWPQANVPALLLPGSNLQSSRLRSSLNARDFHAENLPNFVEAQHPQFLNEFSHLTQPNTSTNSFNHSSRSKPLTPSNREDLFPKEKSSPRYSDQPLASSVFSPMRNAALPNQFLHQRPNMSSPVNPSFLHNNVDHPPLLRNSFAGPLSPQVSMLAQRENQKHQFRSLSSRDLGSRSSGTMGSTFDMWGSPGGEIDWAAFKSEDFGKLRRSFSFDEEPDLSWIEQSLFKEPSKDTNNNKQQLGNDDSGVPATTVDESLIRELLEECTF